MLIFVVTCNILISLINLWIVLKIRRWRRILANVAHTLTQFEQQTHRVLAPAPDVITKGQIGTHDLRQRTLILEVQLQQIQQILALLGLVYIIVQPRSHSQRLSRRIRKGRLGW
jgi:hypothetical protein